MADRKLILLGIDGATYKLYDILIKDGVTPNFEKVISSGVSAILRSTIPPTTPPAWSTCITGKNPGKHGIFDFRESFHYDRKRHLVNSSSLRALKIWHIVNTAGKKAGVMNVPITYPPEKIDGFMITDMMTPNMEVEWTYPTSLKEEIMKHAGDYIINIDIPQYDVELLSDALIFFKDLKYSLEKRIAVFNYLMDEKEWDFFMAVFIFADRIQHLFWKYLIPGLSFYNHKNAPAIRDKVYECFRIFDDFLGHLTRNLDSGTTLLIMSDHGFGSTHSWFNVNRWLKDMGYLYLKGGQDIKKSIFYRLMNLNESKTIKKMIPSPIQSFIRKKIRRTRGTLKTDVDEVVDWEKTRAFFASIPCQGIFINRKTPDGNGVVSENEVESLKEEMRERLLDLRDPETGEKIMDKVWFREEIYEGPYTALAPDILFMAKEYSYLGRHLFGASEWIRSSEKTPNGFHRPDGVFILYGSNVQQGKRIEPIDMVDIAPTSLYSMGIPIPEDMDGKVIKSAFHEEFIQTNPEKRVPPSHFKVALTDVYSKEEDIEVRERLRALGYIE